MKKIEEIITDEELNKAWGNANFGDMSKRQVVMDTLSKACEGYSTGSTARAICEELGLITFGKTRVMKVTAKGFLYFVTAIQQNARPTYHKDINVAESFDYEKKKQAIPIEKITGQFESACTCRDDQKQRPLCPVCDKEEYDKWKKEFNNPVKALKYYPENQEDLQLYNELVYKKIDFGDIQKTIDANREWADNTFVPKPTALSCLRHLKSEVNEAIKEVERKEMFDTEGPALLEFADMYILLFQAAQRLKFSFANVYHAAQNKMKNNKKRTWKQNDKGFHEHEKGNEITITFDYTDPYHVVLTNERGDTYTSKDEELMDFLHVIKL